MQTYLYTFYGLLFEQFQDDYKYNTESEWLLDWSSVCLG